MKTVREVLKTKGSDMYSVRPETTVYDALKLMAEKNIGAVLVLDGERTVGIFSERDCSRGGIARRDGVVCCRANLRRTDDHQTLRGDPASPSAQPAALPLHLSEREELRERTGQQATLYIGL